MGGGGRVGGQNFGHLKFPWVEGEGGLKFGHQKFPWRGEVGSEIWLSDISLGEGVGWWVGGGLGVGVGGRWETGLKEDRLKSSGVGWVVYIPTHVLQTRLVALC